MPEEFEAELATYHRHLSQLLDEGGEGKHVLVQGDNLLGPFDTYEAAITEGYGRFGEESFMVKKVESEETIHTVSRMIF